MEHTKDWVPGVPFLVFTTREFPQESIGFSPNELVYAHRVSGPLSLVKDAWCSDDGECKSLLQYVQHFKICIKGSLEVARENLKWRRGKYHWTDNSRVPVIFTTFTREVDESPPEIECDFQNCSWLLNAEAESTLKTKLSHLDHGQAMQLLKLLSLHREVLGSVTGRTEWIQHDVDIGDAAPMELPPYYISPRLLSALRQTGPSLTVYTDHCPLMYLCNLKKKNQQLTR